MPDLPARFAALIIFAPLLIQRSWLHAQVLLVGVNLASGRRTVVSVLEITGYARQALDQLLWRAEPDAGERPGRTRILLGHLVRSFAPRGPMIGSVDNMIERRQGGPGS